MIEAITHAMASMSGEQKTLTWRKQKQHLLSPT
jgi:hypothetical protein